MLKTKRIRDQKGAAVTGLVIALMFFVLIAGLFAFDASRVQMAQRELTATCDASALAGTAMLTSYDVSNDPNYTKLLNAQQNAAAYSYNMFMMGNVLGRWVRGNTSLVSNLNSLATNIDGEAKVCIGLIDPQNNFAIVAPVAPGNSAGKAIGVYAGYGYHPIFISFFGVGNVGILASSVGGLPQVDAVLVLDFSGSMDDLTPVTLVSRYWDSHQGGASGEPAAAFGYNGAQTDTNGWTDSPAVLAGVWGQSAATIQNNFPELSGHGCITYVETPHPTTNQNILEYVGLDTNQFITGTSLNALPPQNLALSEAGTYLSGSQVIVFKPFLRHSLDRDDYGTPPGNCPCWKQQGATWIPINDIQWNTAGPAPNFMSPYRFTLTDARSYPPHSGVSGTATVQNHGMIYTDLVVNFGQPPNNSKPVQPAWGPNIFQPVNYTFPAAGTGQNNEDDTVIASQSFNFGNIAVVVEAARGNLDQGPNYNGTSLNARGYDLRAGDPALRQYYPPGGTLMTPKLGYQKAYQRLAMWYSQPIATTMDSCDQAFFQRLSALTDCRFGLVGFSDSWDTGAAPQPLSVTTGSSGTWGGPPNTPSFAGVNSYYYDVNYLTVVNSTPRVWDSRLYTNAGNINNARTTHENRQTQSTGGTGQGFRIPRAALNTSITQAQALHTMQKGDPTATYGWNDPNRGNGIYNGRPLNGTMCTEALETARLEFQNAPYNGAQRPGSKRAIIFFTDGVPQNSELSPSGAIADTCKQNGIAIFSIGLNMLGNPQLTQQQTAFLGNSASGLSGRAKNGGRFFMCQDVSQVQQAFSAIARRLTQSQK